MIQMNSEIQPTTDYCLADFTFAQRALAAAAIFAFAAALILRLVAKGFGATLFASLIFTQRAFWAAAILALPAAVNFLRTCLLAFRGVGIPLLFPSNGNNFSNWVCNTTIWSLRFAARLNWAAVSR